MDKECASVLVFGEGLYEILSQKERGRRYSPIEQFRRSYGIEVLLSPSVLEEAVKAIKGACLILVDLRARISVETAWDLGFIYGMRRNEALVGIGTKKHPDKITRTFIHKLRHRIFFSEIVAHENIWGGFGEGISRCWEQCGEDVKKVIDRLQVTIQTLEEILIFRL